MEADARHQMPDRPPMTCRTGAHHESDTAQPTAGPLPSRLDKLRWAVLGTGGKRP
ncbi:hypothetical protein KCP76_26110 (plasmid) [Salmonella enterica subsp. enterica serovar Weltevreden]|nr:hypothetical protein KCP76_26110 [Salmonella enterica subsp. enterica serovar Weltevreden]